MKNSRKYMSDKYLLLFFILTLLWTWICGFTPVIFDFTGTPAGTFLFYFGGGAPSVVALFLVFFTYPKEKIKDYFRRCFSFKYMGWKWPLITICVFSVITIISLFIGIGLLKYDMPTMDFMHAIIDNPIMLLSPVSGISAGAASCFTSKVSTPEVKYTLTVPDV